MVAAAFGTFVGLAGRDGADEADDGVGVTVAAVGALGGAGVPFGAADPAASAESRALIMVCSSSRLRSGDASARTWLGRPAGSTM